MNLIKWFAVMLALAVPVMVAWYSVLSLLVRPFGIRFGLHWPTKAGRTKASLEYGALTARQYIIVDGVLGFGIYLALLLNAADYVGYRIGIHEAVSVTDLVGNLIIFPLVGLWSGYSSWERRSRITPKNIGS